MTSFAKPVLRIANCSGFYGDRFAAAREMVEGGPIDFLTGDYLAELTLLILWKNQRRDPSSGYATTYLRQMEEVLGACLEKGIKVVTNAGGLNPASLAAKMRELADRLGLHARIAHIEGDDLLAKLPDLQQHGGRRTNALGYVHISGSANGCGCRRSVDIRYIHYRRSTVNHSC